jgi:hypothetical protein
MNGFVTGLVTGLLSVSAIALAPGPDAHQGSTPGSAPEKEKLEQTFHVDVFLRDAPGWRDNTASREVQIVRACLSPYLNRVAAPEDCVAAVRAALTASFTGRLAVEELDNSYKAIWDAERKEFRIVCCDSLAIQVNVDGTVVSVPVTIGTFLD